MNSEQIEQCINNRYSQHRFINDPEPLPGGKPIRVIYNQRFSVTKPFQSIVMPIHNQENILVSNLSLILENTTQYSYEFVFVLDSCSDRSSEVLLKWVQETVFPTRVTRILILESPTPLFETAADNAGFLVAEGAYFLEIQADMQILDYGYNERLQRPFQLNSRVVGISGRCVHNMTNKIGHGKLGVAIEDVLDPNIQFNGYYIGETCNRGPLLLDAQKVYELGYLDERHFFLYNSDHDFFFRAFEKGWVCGYVPVEVISPLHHGSTRKARDPMNEQAYQHLSSRSQHESFLWKSLSAKPAPRPIVFVPY